MTKIKTSKSDEFGKVRATSFGKVQFDEKGIAEVEQETAHALVGTSPSLSIVEEESDPTSDQIQAEKEKAEAEALKVEAEKAEVERLAAEKVEAEKVEVEEVDDITSDSKEEIKFSEEDLEQFGMAELREVLKEAGVPEEEYVDIKGKEGKPELIKLIISKQ